jgi:hypothetical protein
VLDLERNYWFILGRNRSLVCAPTRARFVYRRKWKGDFRGRVYFSFVLVSDTQCVHKAVAMQRRVIYNCSFARSGGSYVFVH